MKEPMLVGRDFQESARCLPEDMLSDAAWDAFRLLKRMTSRFRFRRVETRWPLMTLATYALVLDEHCEVEGRREKIIKMVARRSKLDKLTVEGMAHQDILISMGTIPEWCNP